MNYILHINKLIAQHKEAIKRYDKLMHDILELGQEETAKKVRRFGRKMGVEPRPQNQNGKTLKALLMEHTQKVEGWVSCKDLFKQVIDNGLKTTSKHPENMLRVELDKLVAKKLLSKRGKRGNLRVAVTKKGRDYEL